jgi:hypothetical protein
MNTIFHNAPIIIMNDNQDLQNGRNIDLDHAYWTMPMTAAL